MSDYIGVFIILTVLVILLLVVSVANFILISKMISIFRKGIKRNRIELIREYNNIVEVLRGINNFVLDYQSQKRLSNINDMIEYHSNDQKKFEDIDVPKVEFATEGIGEKH